MGDDVSTDVDRDVKHERHGSEDTRMAEDKPTYKSWKKKYRKMRVTFDRKMHECDELHKQEQNALATAKRIAIENDRILDLLLEANQSQQLPLDKRVGGIALTPPSSTDDLDLDIDKTSPTAMPQPSKSLEELAKTVPHTSYAKAKDHFPTLVADIESADTETRPLSFLSPEDIDDYLFEVDGRIGDTTAVPALASRKDATSSGHANTSSQNIALRNPASVYNWLRKHAPKTFLQDAESADKDDGHQDEAPVEPKRKRRSGVGAGAEGVTKSTRGGGRGSRGGKRRPATERASIQQKEHNEERGDVSMDDDPDFSFSTPAPASSRAGGKRKRDDDPGYRPKGGSGSRPTKKKRKSSGVGVDGADGGTPTVGRGGSSRRGGKSRLSEGGRAKQEHVED